MLPYAWLVLPPPSTARRALGLRALVVTADDGGLTELGDRDILACVAMRTVRAVSLIVTGPTWRDLARRLIAEGVDVGLHLNLTDGPSLTGGASLLTDASGAFCLTKDALHRAARTGALPLQAIADEVSAQWRALCDVAAPRFVNGHNHIHVCRVVQQALDQVLPEERPWIRVPRHGPHAPEFLQTDDAQRGCEALSRLGPTCPAFAGWAFCLGPSRATLARELAASTAGPLEWMTHPASRRGTVFGEDPRRRAERAVLTDPDLLPWLEDHGFRPVGFGELS